MPLPRDASDVYAEVLQTRSATQSSPILVVEGPSDSRSLAPHLSDEVEVVVGVGRASVELAIVKANAAPLKLVVGVADSDEDARYPRSVAVPNLICSERHDLDADLFFAGNAVPRLIRVMSRAVDREAHCESEAFPDPLSIVVHLASVVGVLRGLSVDRRLELATSELPVDAFATKVGLLDTGKAAKIVFDKSVSPKYDAVQVEQNLHASRRNSVADELICSGHDLIAFLRVAINWWGGRNVSKEQLADSLRASVSTDEFSTTHVCSELNRWSAANNVTVIVGL